MEAVREALQYEAMHEEVHGDEDVGDITCKFQSFQSRHACSLLKSSCGTMT